MKKLKSVFMAVSLLISESGYGQYTSRPASPPPPPPPSYRYTPTSQPAWKNQNTQAHSAPVPNSLLANNQYYEGNLDGLREYMNSAQSANPELYRQLSPDLEKMEHDNTTANWVFWSGIAAGGALAIAGWTVLAKKTKKDYGYAGTDEVIEYNNGAIYGGLFIMAAGPLLALIWRPGRKEYMNFINKHNKLSPNNPLSWQLGFLPDKSNSSPYLGLAYSF